MDTILVDDPSLISNVREAPPLGSSDHLCILFNLELVKNENNNFIIDVKDAKNFAPNQQNLGYYNTNKTDWSLANEFLSEVEWNELFAGVSCINHYWMIFYSVIVYAISLFTPVKRNTTIGIRRSRKRSGKFRKSYLKKINKLRSKKFKSWKRFKSRPTQCRKATYKRHAKTYKMELHKHITSVENNLISSNNCRSFYNYVNKNIKPKGSVPPLADSTGTM